MLLCGLIFCGCASGSDPVQQQPAETAGISIMTGSTTETEPTPETAPLETLPAVTEPEIPHLSDTDPGVYPIEPSEFEQLVEFESGVLSGSAEISDVREGWSGGGCVTGLYPDGSVSVSAEIPSPQHYNLTLRAASDSEQSGSLTINGSPVAEFTLSGSGEFEALRFDNIYLSASEITLSVAGLSGNVDLDCIMISNSSDIIDLSYDLDSAALSNPSSDENSSRLYSYILANYGEKILSGQQVSQGTNAELELVYETTGRYPAIRFGELMDYSAGSDTGDIELALEWASGGGIVGYVWNWPMSGSVYQSRTGFDLQKAVSDLDLATVEPAELVEKYDAEEVSAETLAIIDGIDLAAAQLKRLCDAGVPVIFRPLPEASSGIFWWSRDKDSYLWLYKLIYERFTEYHSLTNLIWVWNGQDAEWYPGDEYCDIISLDVYYPSGSPAAGRSGINFFLSARGVSAEKPVALSECSNFPIPDYSAMDRAFWSFASAWTGDYSPGGEYMPDAAWIRFYNSSLVLTLDEIDNNQ